jgi:hypothetical protein
MISLYGEITDKRGGALMRKYKYNDGWGGETRGISTSFAQIYERENL